MVPMSGCNNDIRRVFMFESMKESPGEKSFWKNLEIKTLEKKFEKKSLEKMSLEIKSYVLVSWDFFPKIGWGLRIKSPEIRSQEIKS